MVAFSQSEFQVCFWQQRWDLQCNLHVARSCEEGARKEHHHMKRHMWPMCPPQGHRVRERRDAVGIANKIAFLGHYDYVRV